MQVDFASTTIPTILLWGVGLLVFLVGGLLGYFNMNMDARKKLEEADQKVEAARAEAQRKLAEAEGKLTEAQALKAQTPQGMNEAALLKLKNDENFRVQIEMDGQLLTVPLTPERRKRLIELISHVRPWLEGGTTMQASAPQQTFTPAPSAPLASRQQEPVPIPAAPPTVTPVPAKLTLNPQKPKADPETEFKLLSMVKQIDVVLQKRIAGTPLEPLGVHLQDTLQGGLEVVIGSKKFETIDDVPDVNIKDAIRAAIAEWEQKYVPGTS